MSEHVAVMIGVAGSILGVLVLCIIPILLVMDKEEWLDIEIKRSWLTSWFTQYFQWMTIAQMPKQDLAVYLEADRGVIRDRAGNVVAWLDQSGNEVNLQGEARQDHVDPHPQSFNTQSFDNGWREEIRAIEAFRNRNEHWMLTPEDLDRLQEELPARFDQTNDIADVTVDRDVERFDVIALPEYRVRRRYVNGLGAQVQDETSFNNLRDAALRVYLWNTSTQIVEADLNDGFGWQRIRAQSANQQLYREASVTIEQFRREFGLNTLTVRESNQRRYFDPQPGDILNDVGVWYYGENILKDLPDAPLIKDAIKKAEKSHRDALDTLLRNASCRDNAIARLRAWMKGEEEKHKPTEPPVRRITLLKKNQS